jgi:acetolactate synthase I/II/III large subunit
LQPKLQQVPFDENILCDARIFVSRLLDRLKAANAGKPLPRHEEWNGKCVEWRTKYDPVRPEYFKPNAYRVNGQAFTHPYAFMRRLSDKMTKNDVLVCDLGGTSVVVGHAFDTKLGQRYVTNNGNAPMGFAMAGAIGAWLAAPDRQVAVIIGDGGFNLNIQELQTLVNYGVKIKVFILNNHIYGITKAFQETNFQGRCEACGPVGYNPPDFVKIVKAYGIKAFEIDTNAGIDAVVDRMLAFDGPAVCDVNCHDYHTYEPRIFGWSTPVEDMYPYLPRDEFQANLMIEPYGDWENPEQPDISQPNTAME